MNFDILEQKKSLEGVRLSQHIAEKLEYDTAYWTAFLRGEIKNNTLFLRICFGY